MYILVIGCSEIGYHLAKALLASNHEVVVVDKSRARCDLLTAELGSVALQGDGTDQTVLRKAGASRAGLVVAATDRDDTNLVACQVAKHRFGAVRTISLVNIPDHDPLFGLLGIDQTINITELIVGRIEEHLGGLMFEELDSAG